MENQKKLSQRVKEQINLVDLLYRLGYHGVQKGRNYFYNSPLRDEKTPSFSVHASKSLWKDWGDGSAGNIIDFGERYFGSVSNFFKELRRYYPELFNETPLKQVNKNERPVAGNDEKDGPEIKVLQVKTLHSFPLLQYIKERRIPETIADQFCKEVTYELKGKTYYAIGFKNNAGGYALRNRYMKSATMPNDATFIDNGSKSLAIFEGFFDFLSYKTLYHNQEEPPRNFLILNSTSFFEKCLPLMQQHHRVHGFIDNDKTGDKCTTKAQEVLKEKYIDERSLYKLYNDLNDFIKNFGQKPKNQLSQKL
jgi:hypothetical protein